MSIEPLRILCNACGHGFDVPPGSLEVGCPECGARITLTAMETRPGARERPAPDPAALVGVRLGGYELRSILGGGGMGTVYEAARVDASFPGPEIAAVKVLSAAFTHEAQFVERFRREADALTKLRHANLIEVYARGEHPSAEEGQTHYYFVMERFFGEDLRSLMARGAVAPETAAAIVRQAAEGLSYAHANGIVHRDVKPANILVQGDPAKDGRVKVVDFGVAQLASSNYTLTSLTSSSLVLGTINYMSPEQRIDASEIDHRADVYALGVVAYELLTGRLPIGAFELPSELASVGRAADRAVVAALRRDPAHRPANVIAFANQLESALARRRSLPLRWAVTAGLAAIAVAGATYVANELDTIETQTQSESQALSKAPPAQNDAPPASIEPAPYVAPEAIRVLAERMRQDAEYALSRSIVAPPPEPKKVPVKKKSAGARETVQMNAEPEKKAAAVPVELRTAKPLKAAPPIRSDVQSGAQSIPQAQITDGELD